MTLSDAINGAGMGRLVSQVLMELTGTPGGMLIQVLDDHLLALGRESIMRALGPPRLIAQRLTDGLEGSGPEFVEVTAGHAEALGHLLTGLTPQQSKNGVELHSSRCGPPNHRVASPELSQFPRKERARMLGV